MSGENSGSCDKMPSTSEKDLTTPLGTSGADPNTEASTQKNTPNTSTTVTAAADPAAAASFSAIEGDSLKSPPQEEGSNNGNS